MPGHPPWILASPVSNSSEKYSSVSVSRVGDYWETQITFCSWQFCSTSCNELTVQRSVWWQELNITQGSCYLLLLITAPHTMTPGWSWSRHVMVMSPCHLQSPVMSWRQMAISEGPSVRITVSQSHRHVGKGYFWAKYLGVVFRMFLAKKEWFCSMVHIHYITNKLSNINDIIRWNDFWNFSKSARWCRL